VAIVERRAAIGRGTAYAEFPREALLNVPAGAMSADPARPDGFVRWLGTAEPAAFVPRHQYGAYLTAMLSEARARTGAIDCLRADIVDVTDAAATRRLIDRTGRTVARARSVVLALGAPAPAAIVAEPPPDLPDHRAYVADPWAFLRKPAFAPSGEIVIVGSGLTALDCIAAFARGGGTNRLQVISRGGRFPLAHATAPTGPPIAPLKPSDLPPTLAQIVASVRAAARDAQARGADWRAVMDGLRPLIPELWSGLDLAERRRFLRHVRPLFDPHRHRAPAALLTLKERLVTRGQLTLRAARIVAVTPRQGGIDLTLRARGDDVVATIHAAQVINCGGPANDYARSADPLIQNLLGRGLISVDPTGLGLRALPDGRLIDALGRAANDVFTIGWPMRGTLLETTAVRELREHAATLGQLLSRALVATD
jgi:uncharacterized NAD(P)/FAD-binding protein YdhS